MGVLTAVIQSVEPEWKLSADLREAAAQMTADEARFLVDAYYTMQENRKRAENQVRAMSESGEPNAVLRWYGDTARILEGQVKAALDKYSRSSLLGEWARSVKGIGPVIAAGLLAHIDVEKAEVASSLWRFAGLDPTVTWEKGEKRPWNASLKTLCWKIGESFVKVSGHEDAQYGRLYLERKAHEVARNDAGELAGEAARMLKKSPKHKQVATYKQGRLPDGHLHMRAKRWTTKLFLAHYLEVGRRMAGLPVAAPYPITRLGHAHKIEPAGKI